MVEVKSHVCSILHIKFYILFFLPSIFSVKPSACVGTGTVFMKNIKIHCALLQNTNKSNLIQEKINIELQAHTAQDKGKWCEVLRRILHYKKVPRDTKHFALEHFWASYM